MSELIDTQPGIVTRGKTEDGKFYTETTFFDDESLAQNRRIADSGMLDGGKLGLHDDEDIRFVLSCPSVEQWNLFKKKYPDIYKALMSRDEKARMVGARRLSLLKPAWVIYSRF